MKQATSGHGIIAAAIVASSVVVGVPLTKLANNLPLQSCFLNTTDLAILRATRSQDPNAHFRCDSGFKTLISEGANNEPEVIPPTGYTQLAQQTSGQCASPGAIDGCRYDSNITIPAPN